MSKVLTLAEMLEKDFTGENVLIIGCPASGKSTIANMILERNPDHTLLRTDDYMSHGYEQSLYVMIEDMKAKVNNDEVPMIIEGILGYRLLRKGVELDFYYPDVVIELVITDERMEKTYNAERDPEKLKGARSQTKACATILGKYKEMFIKDGLYPEWIQIYNNY